MTVTEIITALIAIGGSTAGGAAITALANARRNKAQSETEARAQNTNEFNVIKGALNEQMDRMQKQIEALEKRLDTSERKHAEAEKYIDLLIVGISNQEVPPIPKRP